MSELLRERIPLNDGTSIPLIGLGTWQLKEKDVINAVEKAINMGYRHIDCAAIYENQADIGEILDKLINQSKSIKREELFITSKLWNTKHAYEDVIEACKHTLEILKSDYIDLYLIHWPFSFESDQNGYSRVDENGVAVIKPVPLSETWKAMEELVKMGLVKSIGVSNFNVKHLQEILEICTIKPVANQIELHPYLPQYSLHKFCEENNIQLISYSSLGSGKNPSLKEDQVIQRMALALQMTPSQLLLSWSISRGIPVIPRTSNEKHLEENAILKRLNSADMKEINLIPIRYRYINPVDFWKHDCFDAL